MEDVPGNPYMKTSPAVDASVWKLRFRHEQRARKLGHVRVAGVDEAGRGPLAGPVVAACVVLPDPPLGFAGVDDSKLIPPRRRRELAMHIHEHALGVGIGVVDAHTIDRVNILRATFLAMEKAVAGLDEEPHFILVDGRLRPPWKWPTQTLVAGETHSLSVAAASIIAKVTRDRIMEDYDPLFPHYGFGRHKGYGTQAHLDALAAYGPCELHRRTFQPLSQLRLPFQPV